MPDNTLVINLDPSQLAASEPAKVLETLQNLQQVDPDKLNGILQVFSNLTDNPVAGYPVEEMLSQLAAQDLSSLKQMGELFEILDKAIYVFELGQIMSDSSLDDIARAQQLAEKGYEGIASLMLNATPGINIIINLPIVGEPVEVFLRKSGMYIGDTVGGAMDRGIDWMADKTGLKDWIIRNRENIRLFVSDPEELGRRTRIKIESKFQKREVQVENRIAPVCSEVRNSSESLNNMLNSWK